MKIAIVGGGASGVLAAIHLTRRLGSDARITIFEPGPQLGAGLAYSTDVPVHLLNVPAAKMSVFEDHPTDFCDWLEANSAEALQGPHAPFVSRTLFRRYLQARLPRTVMWRREKINVLRRREKGWEISGQHFDYCVQATGYNQTELSKASPKNPKAVVIAGSGLTAIDHWRRLRFEGYEGEIHFVSPRGRFPLPHSTTTSTPSELKADFSSPLKLLRSLRNETQAWPDVADTLRPRVASIWGDWTPSQRNQFRRHVRRYWDVIRHRLPATIHNELQAELQVNRAFIHRGRIRCGEGWGEFAATEIIDARGAGLAPSPIVIGRSHGLFVIGPAAKEKLWEVTAIPEIRRQAAALAEDIDLRTRLCYPESSTILERDL